jgi:hypothetical protein
MEVSQARDDLCQASLSQDLNLLLAVLESVAASRTQTSPLHLQLGTQHPTEMKRKRRERDRPKSGPEALYNPNRRVLLSYESDDEASGEMESTPSTGVPETLERVPVDYTIEEYADGDDEYVPPSAVDAPKSDTAGAMREADEDSFEEYEEQPRRTKKKAYGRSIRMNQATGQRPALGRLSFQSESDGSDNEDSDSAEDDEAIAYIKAVR